MPQISDISPHTTSEPEAHKIPMLTNVSSFKSWLQSSGPLRVYKKGAKTGETVGLLMDLKEFMDGLGQFPIQLRRQSISSSESSSSSTEYDQDNTRVYILIVKWLSLGMPFAEPGGSGSLVFARVGKHIVPLCWIKRRR